MCKLIKISKLITVIGPMLPPIEEPCNLPVVAQAPMFKGSNKLWFNKKLPK